MGYRFPALDLLLRMMAPQWPLLLLSLLVIATLLIGFAFGASSFDDAYITYRYARNIVEGKGFVYNEGEHVLGTTTPLYTILLASLGFFYPDLPLVSHIIGVISWALSVVLIFLMARLLHGHEVGLIAAILLATNPLLAWSLGLETNLYITLCLAAFYFYLSAHLTFSTLLLALLFLTRGDGIILALVILGDYVRRERRLPWPQMALFGTLVAPWFLYSLLTFGSFLPHTLAAKFGQVRWMTGGYVTSFLRGLLRLYLNGFGQQRPVYLPFLPLSAVGLLKVIKERGRGLLLIVWAALYLTGYVLLGVTNYHWYYAPLMPVVGLLAGLGVEYLSSILAAQVRSLPSRGRAVCRWTSLVLFLLPLSWAQSRSIEGSLRSLPSPRNETYYEVGNWLRENTEEGTSVAVVEIGIIGYLSQRTIVDTMGLVTPDVAQHLVGWEQSVVYALERFSPDYAVALSNTAWDLVCEKDWFQERYSPLKTFINPSDSISPVTVHERKGNGPAPAYTISGETDLTFGKGLRLTGWELDDISPGAGEKVHLTLHWEAVQRMRESYGIVVSLVDGNTWEVLTWQEDLPMHGGNPTTLWRAGEMVQDEHTIRVPADASPGRYRLEVSVYSPSADGLIPFTTPEATQVDDLAFLTYIKVPLQESEGYVISRPYAADFGGRVALLGYNLSQSAIDAEGTIRLSLYWQATAKMGKDYTVFTHLLDVENRIWAQKDNQPRGGAYPTSIWEVGEIVRDEYLLVLRPGAPGGKYRLEIGLYDLDTGERLPLLDEGGQAIDDKVILDSSIWVR